MPRPPEQTLVFRNLNGILRNLAMKQACKAPDSGRRILCNRLQLWRGRSMNCLHHTVFRLACTQVLLRNDGDPCLAIEQLPGDLARRREA